MANYNNIKATIDGNIFENGSELITGSILNDVLKQMVDAFAVGYQYKGAATPSLNPGSPDARVFYLTTTPGTYTRFGGLTVGSGELALLRWDSSWHKDSFSVGGGGGGGDVTVIDNLYSSSPIDALSANQGRILNGKIAELVLKVDSSNIIAEFASSFAELSEQYPLIYVDGHTKILPVSGESTGWLFETPSGWRIVTSDLDSEFGAVSSFEEVLSGIASISVPLRTEVIDNLTSTSATAALSAKQGGVLKDRIDSRVLVVDASEKISDHVSDVKDLGIYPHINVAGVGDILPIYESTVGWLYEYQEGWRIAGDIANFDINKTFDELMARLDEISSPIYTKPSSGIPQSDLNPTLSEKIDEAMAEASWAFNTVGPLNDGAVRHDIAQSLTDAQKETVRGNITAMANTPSGDPCHYLYEDAGAEYNATNANIEKTAPWGDTVQHLPGFWYLNGLGDITTEQMREIYNYCTLAGTSPRQGMFSFANIRTNLVLGNTYEYWTNTFKLAFFVYRSQLEVLNVGTWSTYILMGGTDNRYFASASNIRYIIGPIDIKAATSTALGEKLEYAQFKGITSNYNLSPCSNFRAESVAYMITNAGAAAITITLHATAYARAMADPAVQAALAAKTNVTLASA